MSSEPQSFASTAQQLWAVAATVLHWTPDTFWLATPAELVSAFPAEAAPAQNTMTRADLERMLKGTNNG